MGHTDDSRLSHARMGVENLLHLAWIDVVAAPDNQILLPVDNEEEAVGVDIPEVTGMKPPTGKRLGRRFRVLVVAAGRVDASDDQLPDVVSACWQPLAVLVPDLYVDTPDRLADAVDLALLGADIECRRGGGLGHPVTFEDDDPELF